MFKAKKNYSLGLNVNWKAGTLGVVSRISDIVYAVSKAVELQCVNFISSVEKVIEINWQNFGTEFMFNDLLCRSLSSRLKRHRTLQNMTKKALYSIIKCQEGRNAHDALCTVQQNKNLKYK